MHYSIGSQFSDGLSLFNVSCRYRNTIHIPTPQGRVDLARIQIPWLWRLTIYNNLYVMVDKYSNKVNIMYIIYAIFMINLYIFIYIYF